MKLSGLDEMYRETGLIGAIKLKFSKRKYTHESAGGTS